MDRKQLGRIGLVKAIEYFTLQGYTVSIPINDTQWYDLIVEKDGVFNTVQCKATKTRENIIDFRCTGGTKGIQYDHVLNHNNLDYLFCVGNDLSCYNIPIKDIISFGCKNCITLNKIPNKNNQGFETYKYLV